jgi:hypothetical protein
MINFESTFGYFVRGGIQGAFIAGVFVYGFYKGLETKTNEYNKLQKKQKINKDG